MGAHRSSIREDAMVGAAAMELHIIDGNGDLRIVKRAQQDDEWFAASTSLGLLGIIARIKMRVYPDSKLYAMQKT
jgi:FAD/FMN-containing dehydrogenase